MNIIHFRPSRKDGVIQSRLDRYVTNGATRPPKVNPNGALGRRILLTRGKRVA